ncbi:MAG: hypothetical protein LBO20_07150 [Bifidobacteriaceae bacterium]|nr:hypothetical protein [Bifidobacteriaceae bacterium]
MSWDVFLCRFAQRYQSVSEIPDDAEPLPIAERAVVLEAIDKVFPGVAWEDAGAWGSWDSPIGSVEFSVSAEDEPVDSVGLFVRGASEAIIERIFALMEQLDCQAFNPGSDSGFLDASAVKSLTDWTDYRNRVAGGDSP